MPRLEWIGKDKVVNHHMEVPFHVLEHKYGFDESGMHEERMDSGNMIIHGDNLVALKSLLPQFEGKIKCIYIDPPYNTGNEKWCYNDNVNDPRIKTWLGQVVGKEGEDLSRHDKWLCMMYPRLRLLHRLLRDDGVIFISIDDNEQSALKLICDEIFGRNNFVKQFVWYTAGHTDNQDTITHVHEYILCYAKQIKFLRFNKIVDPAVPEGSKIRRSTAENSITKNGSKNPPSYVVLPIGFPCESEEMKLDITNHAEQFCSEADISREITREMTKKYNISYPVRLDEMVVKHNRLLKECRVYSGWMNRSKLEKFIANDCNPIEDAGTFLSFYLSNNGVIYYKREGRETSYIQTILENKGTTETNKYMLEDMGLKFDYPKPLDLISYIIDMVVKDGDICLDSFAGSGTTAHAILNANHTDGGTRRFILVELGDYAESVTAERVKKAIQGFGSKKKSVEGTGGNFDFYDIMEEPFFYDGNNINPRVPVDEIRKYIYFMETRKPIINSGNINDAAYLGYDNGIAYYLFYSVDSISCLNHALLTKIKTKADSYVIYADTCQLSRQELDRYNITFKKIPRDITKL